MSGGNLTKEKHSILGIEILTKKLYLVLIGLLSRYFLHILGNRKQWEIVPLIMDPADKATTYY